MPSHLKIPGGSKYPVSRVQAGYIDGPYAVMQRQSGATPVLFAVWRLWAVQNPLYGQSRRAKNDPSQMRRPGGLYARGVELHACAFWRLMREKNDILG